MAQLRGASSERTLLLSMHKRLRVTLKLGGIRQRLDRGKIEVASVRAKACGDLRGRGASQQRCSSVISPEAEPTKESGSKRVATSRGVDHIHREGLHLL